MAYHFGIIDVDSLAETLPYEMLLKWSVYFEKRPIGWREDDRTYKLMAAWGTKEKPYNIFGTLVPIYLADKPRTLNVQKFKRSMMFQKLTSAKGGKQLDL